MTSLPRPVVTIGIPVCNGGKVFRGVLESIVAQTRKDFKVVISDNASTDDTESICREFQDRDSRVTYIRQKQNIGAEANFDFVRTAADTQYFMWAAADDVRSSDFLEKNIEFLDLHPDFVASISPVRFDDGEFDPIHMGDETLDAADPFERILKYLETWHANGRMYSLFRTEALRDAKPTGYRYLGGDWTVVVDLLAKGKFKRLDSGFVVRGRKGVSNSLNIFAIYRNRLVCWIFPFYDFSVKVLRLFSRANFNQKTKVRRLLLSLNFNAFRSQIRYSLRRTYLKCRRPFSPFEPSRSR